MAFFRKKKEIPHGLWMKCPACGKTVFTNAVEQNLNVCPECGFHMKISANERMKLLLDAESFEPLGEDVVPIDALRFVDREPYDEKLDRSRAKTTRTEAALAGRGLLGGRPVTLCILDFGFMGGSMGVVVGERVALAADDAREREVPLLVVATSGGARMHEGALSLMQMAKTSAAIAKFKETGLPYVAILADPCTGGVSASFAAQGDITIAEPGALIGFAGPRVIEGTIKKTLPEGFQRAEFLLEHGYIDRIVNRAEMKDELGKLLDYLYPRGAEEAAKVEAARAEAARKEEEEAAAAEAKALEAKAAKDKKKGKKSKASTKKSAG